MGMAPSTSRRLSSLLIAVSIWISLMIPSMETLPLASAAADPRAATGEWSSVINWQIFGKHMAMLPNGKVLAWPTGQDAFVWDPATGTKVAVPATFGDLHCAAQTMLPDGRVLVAGGVVVSPHDGTTVTAIFDPETNLWSQKAPMHYPRWYGTSTTLPNGNVLVTSGDMPGDMRANIPEIYDVANDTWTLMPASATKDLGLYPQMYVLPNGKIYKAGTTTATSLLDINAGTWTPGPQNAFGSSGYAESSAMYAPGKIIRSGGDLPKQSEVAEANTAIIDMTAATPQWKQTQPMNFPRRRHNLVILADGEVMAVGGTRSADDLSSAVYEGEIWNPATEQWTVVPRMTKDRMYHSAAMLLPDGRVLTAGGEYTGRMNAEIYSPPYLFMGPRPTITAAPAAIGYGTGFSVGFTTDGTSTVSSVALIDLSAVTHAFNHNQRYVPLNFTVSGNSLTATAPANANYAPPGYYMLVVKDSKGVPSVAKFVRVDSAANLLPGTITGKITDKATGNAVANVTVSANNLSTTTNNAGVYTLTNVTPGEVLISASKTGYATSSQTAAVVGNETSKVDFALAAPGTITGKITDSASGTPIAGATVLYQGGSTTSGSDGTYTINGIASGSQTLVASADGYNSSPEQVVTVPANGSVTANISLLVKPTYIAGEVKDTQTGKTVPDVTITVGNVVATTDSIGRYLMDLPPGTYSVTATKKGYITKVNTNVTVTFGSYTASDFLLTPSDAPVTFDTVGDDYVSSTNLNNNYGTAAYMKVITGVNNSVTASGYMKFNVASLLRPIQSAKLRLYVTRAADKGGAVYAVANTYKGTTTPWTETGLKGINAPDITGTPLSSVGATTVNTWVEFDVTPALTGNGTFSFAVKAASTNELNYSSKEGTAGNQPQLVIQQFPAPIVAALSTNSAKPGEEVIITGSGLAGASQVTFGGVPVASFTVDSATQIRAIVPANAVNGAIIVTAPGGQATSEVTFTVVALPIPPTISAFSPGSGKVGTEVTITGTNFTAATSVSFGGRLATSFTIDSATQIRAIVPAAAVNGTIMVTTDSGSATSAASFEITVDPAPQPTDSAKRVFIPLSRNGVSSTAQIQPAYNPLTVDQRSATQRNPFFCTFDL